MRILKWGIRLIILFVVLGIIAAVAVAGWHVRSRPQVDGEVRVSGITLPVDVIRSQHGIPIIKANTAADAYFALGYVHAQDRLWQMDMQRRVAEGRLSEILGSSTLDVDKFMRALNLRKLARGDYENLDIKDALEAYTAGINSYLGKGLTLPLEFTILNYRPEPWKPEDSLLLGRLMGLFLSVNFYDEVRQLNIAQKLDPALLQDLFPGTASGPRIVEVPVMDSRALARMQQVLGTVLPFGASNAWAVSSRSATSDGTYLATDPHLSLSTPSFWYLAKLRAPEFRLAGATFPGIPHILIGHSRTMAWGLTTSYIDTQDLVAEQLKAGSETEYYEGEDYKTFNLRRETIMVRGGSDIHYTIRETEDGPVISDIFADLRDLPLKQQVLVLKSTALDPANRSAEAIQNMNWASNLGEFLNAASQLDAPAQNIVYADVNGNIGMISAGKIPLRPYPFEVGRPVPGWSMETVWPQYLNELERPSFLNPPSGTVLNANNRVTSPDFPHALAHNYPPDYRALRIQELLRESGVMSMDTMGRMQLDNDSYMARDFLPVLTALLNTTAFESEPEKAALTILKDWDYRMQGASPAPVIFLRWLKDIQDHLLDAQSAGLSAEFKRFETDFLQRALTPGARWCQKSSCTQIVTTSFRQVVGELVNLYGIDPHNWRWDDFHKVEFAHQIYGRIPFLRDYLVPVIGDSGGPFTVNRSDYDFSNANPFQKVHGPSLRAVFDLNNLENSRFMIAPGQSGNIFSPNYADLVTPWQQGQFVTLDENAGKFQELSIGKLTLRPL